MKKTILAISCAFLFFACKKPNPTVYCWKCVINDSVTSNVPGLKDSSYDQTGEMICGYTGDMINSWEKRNTKTDTTYHRNDTLLVNHYVPTCQIDH